MLRSTPAVPLKEGLKSGSRKNAKGVPLAESNIEKEDVDEEEPRSATAKNIKTEKGKRPKKVTDTRSQRKERMRKYVQFYPGERFGKRAWEVTRLIDNGGFGVVYEAWNNEKSMMAALKAEPTTTTGESQLKQEILVIRTVNPLGKAEHFPQIFFATKHRNYAYIIMSLLGDNLKNLRSCEVKNGKQRPPDMIKKDHYLLSVGSWTRVGIQLLYAIKTLHDCGFVHRDIKPANFVIGKGQEMTTLFMLDFGLSRAYAFKIRGKWVPRLARCKSNFRGTARYCSPNMHDKMEQGRRDDIWSFFYILIEAHCGLPWQHEIDRKELERVKCTISDQELTKNMPKSLRECISSLRHLDIYSRPDYTTIFEALDKVKKITKTRCDDLYDWEEYNEDYKRPGWFVSNQYHGWSHNPLPHFNTIEVPSLNPADAHKLYEASTENDDGGGGNSKRMPIPPGDRTFLPPPDVKTGDSKTDAETKTEASKEPTEDVSSKRQIPPLIPLQRTVEGRKATPMIVYVNKGPPQPTKRSPKEQPRSDGSKTDAGTATKEQTRSASSMRKTKQQQTFTDVSSKKSVKDSTRKGSPYSQKDSPHQDSPKSKQSHTEKRKK